jgi:hypothetical protein
MSNYTKPTVTKLGTITEKTQGGWAWVRAEVISKRSSMDGDN